MTDRELGAVDWAPNDISRKEFRTRWRGYAPEEVDLFLQEAGEELQRLQVENANLTKDVQRLEKELKEYKDREKVIRNVLVSTQRAVEQMKANAEKEAKQIIADAELNAEKIQMGAQQRLDKLHAEIIEIKSKRISLESKLRATINAYQLLLENIAEDNQEADEDANGKPKVLNR
jgi:cell division initiation protein